MVCSLTQSCRYLEGGKNSLHTFFFSYQMKEHTAEPASAIRKQPRANADDSMAAQVKGKSED